MKFIRVNMTNKNITVEEVPEKYLGLGGRGLSSVMINNEVPPTCDALGPDNKLIFAAGSLSGTVLVNTSRISVGAKSPLTGGIKESNAGGTIGAAIGHLGITAIIVEGKASDGDLSLLKIDKDGDASLIDAREYKGFRTYELTGNLFEKFGEKNSIMCIGPAGEYKYKSASIQATDVDGNPCRAAARGGLGAVMGSKGLKALILAQGSKSADAVAEPDNFKKAAKEVVKAIKADHMSSEVMPKLGTASLVAPLNLMGAFPCFNSRKGVLEGWENISGEALLEMIEKRGGNASHMGCSQCIINCSNVFVDKQGSYVTGSLEYETIWSMGGMTGIIDLDTIAKLDFLCDDIGVDTMNTGVAVAVAMDSGYKKFGDKNAALDMVEEIARGTEMGNLIGNGPVAVGEYFNNPRIPAVKGQSVAAYDPRAMLGQGVTFATSTMGADHTAGNMVGFYLENKLDPLKEKGQVEGSRFIQTAMAAFDCTGMCFMASVALLGPEANKAFREALGAKFGTTIGPDDFPMAMGTQVLKAEKEFNKKAGLTKKDDRLPDFYYKEPLPPHNTVFTIKDEELDSTFDF